MYIGSRTGFACRKTVALDLDPQLPWPAQAKAMVRSTALVALSAGFLLVAGSLSFVSVTPPRRHQKSFTPSSAEAPEDCTVPTGVPVAMAVLAGLVMAFTAPRAALAQPGARPDFSVVRPGYMQGIDAANAATKPGEIDSSLIFSCFLLACVFLLYPKPVSNCGFVMFPEPSSGLRHPLPH